MRIFLFIINLIVALYGSAPTFTTSEELPEDRHGQVYITVDYGVCLDDYGNGKIYNSDNYYNYISYSGVESAKAGDKIYTFCIMNPDSNECDDIVGRIDVIEGSEEIFINMEGVTDYIVNEYGLYLNFADHTGYWWEW